MVYSVPSFRDNGILWHKYIQPLIDSAVPKELIDFIDFHAFNENALPEVHDDTCILLK